jgi:hypothetical protein
MVLAVLDVNSTDADIEARTALAGETNALLLQLLRLAKACDFGDTVGAAHMQKLASSLLTHRFDPSGDENLSIMTLALYGEGLDSTTAELASWQGGAQLAQRTGLGTHIPGGMIAQALVDILVSGMHGSGLQVAQTICDCILDLATNSDDMTTSAETARALHTLSHFLGQTKQGLDTSCIVDVLNIVVVPCLTSSEMASRALALRCVALAGLLPQRCPTAVSASQDFTAVHASTIASSLKESSEVLHLVAIQAAVDWLCVLDPNSMAIAQPLVQSESGDAVSLAASVAAHLTQNSRETATSSVRALCLEGQGKLLFHGRMPGSVTAVCSGLASMLAAYCLPNSALGQVASDADECAGMRSKQCLASFLPNLAAAAVANRSLIAQAAPSAIRNVTISPFVREASCKKHLMLLADFLQFLLGSTDGAIQLEDAIPPVSAEVYIASCFTVAALADTTASATEALRETAIDSLAKIDPATPCEHHWLSLLRSKSSMLNVAGVKVTKVLDNAVSVLGQQAERAASDFDPATVATIEKALAGLSC